MKSFSSAVLCAACLAMVAAPAPARAESFLNHVAPWLFGAPEEGPRPEDTLLAPFGADKPAPTAHTKEQDKLMNMYDPQKSAEDTSALNTAHRSSEQIGEWVTNITTQSLTIDPATYGTTSINVGTLMTPYASKEYNEFLTKNQILAVLKTNGMKLAAVAETKPELLQEGVLEGSYRWLFKIPLMLTYYQQSSDPAAAPSKMPPQTRRMILNIQVGRVPKNQLADELIVERWTVTAG
jgi:hypothetical protein